MINNNNNNGLIVTNSQVISRGCAVLRLARATIEEPIFVSHVTGLETFPSPSVETSRSGN